MKSRSILLASTLLTIALGAPLALADSGSATGNGTSTPAGPAGQKSGGPVTGASSSGGSMMKSGGGSMMKSSGGGMGSTGNGTSTLGGPAGKSPGPTSK